MIKTELGKPSATNCEMSVLNQTCLSGTQAPEGDQLNMVADLSAAACF
jgi:hypothetical protein